MLTRKIVCYKYVDIAHGVSYTTSRPLVTKLTSIHCYLTLHIFKMLEKTKSRQTSQYLDGSHTPRPVTAQPANSE
jgi:hypothetical protein